MKITRRLASGYRATPTTTTGRKLPGLGAGLGMTIKETSGTSGIAATAGINYWTPGQPKQPEWDGQLASLDYLRNVYVMRSFQTIADTIANLPYCTGMDPTNPSEHYDSALSKLLGPSTPAAPGGPNPKTSSSALWAWSIVQRLVTGKMVWELQRDPQTPAFDGNNAGQVFALWQMVSAFVQPIASTNGAPRWFDAYDYVTPIRRYRKTADQVFYSWKASVKDYREPESVLQSIQMQIGVSNGIMRYMYSLLRNDMVASKMIVAPPFDEDDQRRAWEDQINSEFTGFNNAGKAMFAYAENDYDESTGKQTGQASVQVTDLAMTHVDAQMIELMTQANIDITIGTGVPVSLIGNASQRTFSNADSEYRNFWTIRVLPLLSELQEPVNVELAPQLGKEVGWFDLSRVVALQPPTVFAPPSVKDMLDEGVITTQDVANILNLPALENPSEDTTTAPVGEEAIQSGAMGGRAWMPTQGREGYRAVHHGMKLADNVFAIRKPLNTYTLKTGVWKVERQRERITVSGTRIVAELAGQVIDTVARIQSSRSDSTRIAELEAKVAELESGNRTEFDKWFDDNTRALEQLVS